MIVHQVSTAEVSPEVYPLQDLPPKTRKGNRCRFHNTVFVKEIPSIQTYSQLEKRMCWYNNADYRSFRVSMILERATMDFRDHQKTSTPHKNNSVDQTPVQPWRCSSPERDQTQRSPLNFDDDNDESFEDSCMNAEEEETEEQILKSKEEKLQKLNKDSETQYRFPPHHPLRAIQRHDPLNTSVRHRDDNQIKMMSAHATLPTTKHQQLQYVHIPSQLHISYYPGKALGLCNNHSTSTFDILDSAISIARESRSEAAFLQ